MYDVVGFEWSTLFTVCWNGAVCVAAMISLLVGWVSKCNSITKDHYKYKELEGDNIEYGTMDKEVDRFIGEVQTNISQTDRYQTYI